MIVRLTYRCLRCGNLVVIDHDSPSPTLEAAMEAITMLPRTPGAEVKGRHPCGDGIGIMDLIGGDALPG